MLHRKAHLESQILPTRIANTT